MIRLSGEQMRERLNKVMVNGNNGGLRNGKSNGNNKERENSSSGSKR